MLSADRMEEFQSEEEEPWYDQQDLEQGKETYKKTKHYSTKAMTIFTQGMT